MPAARRTSLKSKLKTRAKDTLKQQLKPEVARKPIGFELIGLCLITLGITLLLGSRLDGQYSERLLHVLQWLFGVYGAWGAAIAMILLGAFFLVRLAHMGFSFAFVGMAVVFFAIIGLLQLRHVPLWDPAQFAATPGGVCGGAIAAGVFALTGASAWVMLVAVGIAGVALMTETPLWKLLLWPFKALYQAARWSAARVTMAHRHRRDIRLAARVAALKDAEVRARNRPLPPATPLVVQPVKATIPLLERVKEKTAAIIMPPSEPPAPVQGIPSQENPEQLQFDDHDLLPTPNQRYALPATELLTLTPKPAHANRDDTQEKIASLETTLASFGIEAKVVGVERGPRVTRFEVVPPPGIRINRITNLADNIALSLAALDVRVEAPVPGKGVVGIEVPNKDLVVVDLREIIESEVSRKAKSPLTFTLGRDIGGHPRVADLSRMPHLLIAGATNSGKSVCINSLLCSILMRATPQQVKLLLVDPKRVELSLFQNIPHLIAPVAYDAKHAAGLLRWAIREMEQRYEMFAEKGVRNIIGFNEQSRLEKMEELPYIVIIIDELADLMMQAAAEFEASICRIAQLARATGIHLVVATQRPSVNVITGTIKANIPSRIAFAVASQVDSRTILDMNGAERLVGQGDMLYMPIDASKPLRIQGAYVSEADINRIVTFVKAQGKPFFTDEIVAIEEEALRTDDGGEMNDEPEDELFTKALDYMRTTKYASTSMLQRKFRIGYTRAARLMDIFEERGFVGPGQGSKPREVIFAPAGSVIGRPADHLSVSDNFDLDA